MTATCQAVTRDSQCDMPCYHPAKYIFTDSTGTYNFCWLHGTLLLKEWENFPVTITLEDNHD